jgi:cytochrome c peroxidase
MKRASATVMALVLSIIFAGLAFGMKHEPTSDKGKALFSDPRLGTIGRTCNDCHAAGKGLEKAGERQDLEQVVNSCITRALKGKALKPASVEMQSLVLYLKSMSAKKQQPAGKKTAVGC